MTGQKELAVFIQTGLLKEEVAESEHCFFEDVFGVFHVCALGAALVGKFGSANKAYSAIEAEREVPVEDSSKDLTLLPGYVDIAANLLEIDFDLAEAIDRAHMLGASAASITEHLKQGTFPV